MPNCLIVKGTFLYDRDSGATQPQLYHMLFVWVAIKCEIKKKKKKKSSQKGKEIWLSDKIHWKKKLVFSFCNVVIIKMLNNLLKSISHPYSALFLFYFSCDLCYRVKTTSIYEETFGKLCTFIHIMPTVLIEKRWMYQWKPQEIRLLGVHVPYFNDCIDAITS